MAAHAVPLTAITGPASRSGMPAPPATRGVSVRTTATQCAAASSVTVPAAPCLDSQPWTRWTTGSTRERTHG
ncbi:hypothetical protein [Modestobacter versicolor]|uniref:Uncharacterized protein n=1 Tax=Modestobacter versicolor TaxID=429133 RepID=A0A323V871_9ACTN|nr:hypothetical protein [Modestobacter versicolor]MBB3676233.1 hypothetical protein [Modestobacter versicolor]PZA20250.1 hypothetical protein DMO24_16480 [Modestobacter versicolor]